jgi:hypothetical protein
MQPVETGRQAQVGAVVHDENYVRPEARPEFPSFIEHVAGASRLVAILQQRAAGSGKFLGGGDQSATIVVSIGEARGVENRVESR